MAAHVTFAFSSCDRIYYQDGVRMVTWPQAIIIVSKVVGMYMRTETDFVFCYSLV